MSFRNIGKYAQRGFAVVGVVTVGTVGVAVYNVRRLREKTTAMVQELPPAFVLDLDFESFELVEKAAPGWTQFTGQQKPQLELKKMVGLLKDAASDDRVKGVFASLGPNQAFPGLAQVQELRNSLTTFRESTQGRIATVAYADSFGESGSRGTIPYYLASAFEKVYMQPSGFLSTNGIAATNPFLKRLLQKLHIQPLWFTRERYKNIANQFTQETYTPEHREATEAVLNGFMDQISSGIASARGLSLSQIQAATDNAPHAADEAVSLKLLDGSKYRDEAIASIANNGAGENGKPLPRIGAVRYCRAMEAAKLAKQGRDWMPEVLGGLLEAGEEGSDKAAAGKKPVVAVITASGPIVAGKRASNVVQGDKVVASGQLCESLSKAREDPAVKAVVLRIDSPGGSAVASDSIHREVLRVKQAGKPIIVSMGNVAASGGYYISTPATKIVASPGTMTGSIGVAFGKFNFNGLLKEYGVDAETISCGKNATAMLPITGFTAEQEGIVNRMTDHIYQAFMSKVAEGRRKSAEEVREIAQGRIWTGQAAFERGLVDKLGGLEDAIMLAKEEAGLPLEDEDAVDVREYPRRRPPFVQLLQRLRGSGPDAAFLISSSPEARVLQLLAATAAGNPAGFGPSMEAAAIDALLAAGGTAFLQEGPQLIAPDIANQSLT